MIKEALFPNEIIIQTDNFRVVQDCEIPIAGFIIINANREIDSVADFNLEETKEFAELMVKLRRGMRDVLGIDEVYMFQREDSEHNFHMWLFPRHGWMKLIGSKIESVRPIMEYAKKNMNTEENKAVVRSAVQKMREYLANNI